MSNIPGITLAALNAIQDENARIVLTELTQGWMIRNAGTALPQDNAFVTRGELTGVLGSDSGQGARGIWPQITDVFSVVGGVQADVASSPDFQDLVGRVADIDQAVVLEQQNRIQAVQGVADRLNAEEQARQGLATTLGGQITTLQQTSGTQALALTSITTRVGTAETNITNLKTTTGTQAQTLNSLGLRVGDAESSISTLTTASQGQANTLQSISATLDTKNRTFFQTSQPVAGAVGDLWFDSDDGNKPYRWDGAAWVFAGTSVNVDGVMAAITAEADARAAQDTAITNSLNSQISAVNGSISQLQDSQTTTANAVSALSQSVTTLQATVGDNTSALQIESQARVDADNSLFAKYSVKIDQNGHVSGYGLMSEANNSTPFSSFVVRADRFAISNQTTGGGVSVRVPFVVENDLVYIDQTVINKLSAGVVDVQKLSGVSSVFAAAGAAQFMVPDGYTTVKLTLRGAGGGAGFAATNRFGSRFYGGGGGQGGLVIQTFTGVTAGSIINISVGAGGAGGYVTYPGGVASISNATAGGATTATISGQTLSAGAGQPGSNADAQASTSGVGGAGGIGGGAGSNGAAGQNGAQGGGGVGGGVTGSGAGGSSPISVSDNAGAPGFAGFCLVEAYNPNGVVLRQEWSTLIGHLNTRFSSYTWP